jgi:hypothetical protein
MKKDDEVEKSARETTALLIETMEVFLASLRAHVDSVVGDIGRYTEKIQREGVKSGAVEELTAVAKSGIEPVAAMMVAIKKHRVQMQREIKVVNHKNAVRANDRLFVALERMKRDTKGLQAKIDAVAKVTHAKGRSGK